MIDQDRIAELTSPCSPTTTGTSPHAVARIGRGGRANPEVVVGALAELSAAPSWALGTGEPGSAGSRSAGSPARRWRKIDDVAALRALTGATRSISLHVPWDDPADPEGLRENAPGRASGSTP